MMGTGPWIEVASAGGPHKPLRYPTITPAQPLAAVLLQDQMWVAMGLGREAECSVQSADVPSLLHALAEHGPLVGIHFFLRASTEA